MDVSVQAFEVTTGTGISIVELLDFVVSKNEKQDVRPYKGRYIYRNISDKWIQGVVLTSKNIKAFSKLIREGKKIILSPEEIKDGELAHFNFFLINKNNSRGFYQHYHGSSSIHGFMDSMKLYHNEFKNELRNRECIKEGLEEPNSKIKKKFKGSLQYNFVLRRKKFEELIQEFDRIKNIEIEFAEYVPT